MAGVVGRRSYLEQLQALLPRGHAWTADPDATLTAVLDVAAAELDRVDRAACALLDEARPDTATQLLPDWERALGLPDACSSLAATLAERRATAVRKIAFSGNLHPRVYRAIAADYDDEVTIIEHDQARAEAIDGLDASDGRWRYVWWAFIAARGAPTRHFDCLSPVTMPLRVFGERNLEAECRLRAVTPAHTHLVIEYVVQ